ncbi:MAG: sigma factor regulator N-terminal domain-containing protein [Moorellaceae bacterium]
MAQGINSHHSNGETSFDEKEFLRKARFKSLLRITLISLGVAVGIVVLSFVVPEIMLQNQENRLDSLYPDLVRFSEPNTVVLGGKSYNVRLFGRQKEYYLLRLIGDKPYPAGTITVDFDVWGGEQTQGNYSFCVRNSTGEDSWPGYPEISPAIPEGAKEYLAPYAVPKLRFYHPAANYEKIIREFEVLKIIPRDNLVEMALSFSKPLTLDEMKALLPRELKLMWGAVCAFKDEDYEGRAYLSERLVGNPCLGGSNGEIEFVKALEGLSRVPSYHSDNLKRTVSFLKENGIRYYGVVVVGNPESLEKLASNERITGAILGIVTTPY